MENVSGTSTGSRCRGHNRFGASCRRLAVRDGYCTVHGPNAQDMAALGRKGGSRSPLTKLRKAVDEDLREQAREVLARALSGEDVDKDALALPRARSTASGRSRRHEAQSASA